MLVRRLTTLRYGSVVENLKSTGVAGKRIVMGIESSCDDTGVALVDESGRVLGDVLHSQLQIHKETGGVVPHAAGLLHRDNLQSVTTTALERSGCGLENVSAVAITIGPGLAPCLKAGLTFAKHLSQKYHKPLIPVHHMAAHALMPRMKMHIPFPFLVLLVSGGHCILGVAEAPNNFKRLGQTRDDSPGEALDKLARWMAVHKDERVPSQLHGGAAIEQLARYGSSEKMEQLAVQIMTKSRCCDFSFSGLKTCARYTITKIASESGWKEQGGCSLPQCEHIAAAFQDAMFKHLLQRTHRALLFCQQTFPQVSHLVVSGGVASNLYLRHMLKKLCEDYSFTLHTVPPHLCTDNGIMIAWSALECLRWAENTALPGRSPWQQLGQAQADVHCEEQFGPLKLIYSEDEVESLEFRPRWPLGKDISEAVKALNIKLPKFKYFGR